jgi:hypothetical protein
MNRERPEDPPSAPSSAAGEVAELPGLYGPFAFPEKLLQKLWLLRLFDRERACLIDGRRLEVLSPGRWNLLGGPDFRGARLRLDGRETVGDVEVHFRAEDWHRHGHEHDAAYADVVLHVILYEPAAGAQPPRTARGEALPQFALLPWLQCALEEFAADDALESVNRRRGMQLAEQLLELPLAERRERVRAAAERRWRQKVHFAGVRCGRLGWDEACHQTALEILGYRFNRAPMLAVATRWPRECWVRERPTPEDLWAAGEPVWQRQAVRPANHPRARLAQYDRWLRLRPDWPVRLQRWAESAATVPRGAAEASPAEIRRSAALGAWRKRLAEDVTGGAVGGARLQTLIANGFLPLLAAVSGRDAFGRWFCDVAGEVGPSLPDALRLAGLCDGRRFPLCEGLAQGALQLSLDSAESPRALH